MLFTKPNFCRYRIDRLAVLHMLRAAARREMGDAKGCRESVSWIVARSEFIVRERQTIPFALFELSILSYDEGNFEGAKSSMNGIREGFSDGYDFDRKLDTKIHLSIARIDDYLKNGYEK